MDKELIQKKAKKQILVLLIVRICLWAVALGFTVNWMVYSFKLYNDGIVLPEEYSPLLRPVLYRGILVAVAAIAISFALHGLANKIKKNAGLNF